MLKKIEDSVNINDLEVMTDTGWVDIKKIHKTKKYYVYQLKTKHFFLECADRHIVFNEKMDEVFVKDLSINDKIQTEKGIEKIISITKTEEYVNMYDLELSENSNRRYYTNGILSHNTLILNAITKDILSAGHNVCYITLEISETEIAKRLDTMYSQVPTPDLILHKDKVKKVLTEQKEDSGRLFIKEFPTGSINVNNIRSYLNELQLHHDFVPDLIIIDYLDLMRPTVKVNFSDTYIALKYIAEELRGLAVEFNCGVWTASQVQRDKYKLSADEDLGMEGTAGSIGKMDTADYVVSLMQDEVFEAIDSIKVFIAKCRFSRPGLNTIFRINYDCLDVREHSITEKYKKGMSKTQIVNEFYHGKEQTKGGKKRKIFKDDDVSGEAETVNDIYEMFQDWNN